MLRDGFSFADDVAVLLDEAKGAVDQVAEDVSSAGERIGVERLRQVRRVEVVQLLREERGKNLVVTRNELVPGPNAEGSSSSFPTCNTVRSGSFSVVFYYEFWPVPPRFLPSCRVLQDQT